MKRPFKTSKVSQIFACFVFFSLTIPSNAQYPGQPTFHDSYSDIYLMGGYQMLFHPTKNYHVATIQSEILLSFYASRVSLTIGPDYISFSPIGIVMFAPKIFVETLKESDAKESTFLLIMGFSAAQWHIPVTNHIEISLGWDALKFTKLRDYSNTFYVTGSLNAGLTCFVNDNLFLNGYYEYNHNHNTILSLADWLFGGINNYQSSVLNGHSFGVRMGWMF